MNEKQIQNMIADTYEESRGNTLRGMIGDFYNRQNTSVVIVIWVFALICIALAVYCGIAFFRTADTRMQIMYATSFIVLMQFVNLCKVFAWQIIHRNGIKREIKRLELRIAELNETIKGR
jgi:hypothetical protein